MTRPSSTRPGSASAPSPASLARLVADDPSAPLSAAVVGPGGTGKTLALDTVARAYADAGVEVLRGGGRDGFPVDRLAVGRVALVDDAHALAPGQLDELRAFARTDASRLVVAYRPWPRPPALAALTAGMAVRRMVVMVSHLDEAAVAARITERLGCPPPEAMVELVHQQSGGLPNLVDLVTHALEDSGRFDPRHPDQFNRPDRITVSVALAERLRHRVDSLEPAVRDVLEAMALGATLDREVLGPLLASPSEDLDATVEAAHSTGLLTESGQLIPVIRTLFLRLTPALRSRDLQQRLAGIELDRGGSVLAAARTLLGANASGSRVAAVFDAAAREALAESPALAADLLAGAVQAGRPAVEVAGRRAHAVALGGDLDEALRHADQVISDPDAPDHEQAVTSAAAVLAHRGLLGASADLHRTLPPAAALLAVPALVATGAIDDARAVLDGVPPGGSQYGSTLLAGAVTLMAQGMVASVCASAPAALSQLSRSGVLLEPVASSTLLPDTPAALTTVVALQCGELSVADTALRRAITGRHGGRPAQTRHRLLHAWLAMNRGGLGSARRVLDRVAHPGLHLEPRDEFVAAALAVALARRTDGARALAATWARARDALVQYPVDLTTLPQLGELAVATAQLGEEGWLEAHLDEVDLLLDRIGRPALWAAPMQWFRLQAAVVAERPAEVARHASALKAAAASSPYADVLSAAATCWSAVLAGDVEPDTLVAVGRRMHAVGLGWEAAQLAGRAAPLAGDRRTTAGLHAFARALQPAAADPTGTAPEELTDAVVPSPQPETPPPAVPGAVEHRAEHRARATTTRPMGTAEAAAAALREVRSPTAASDEQPTFSERELEIGRFILAGLTYRQIGERLYISAKTVEHHVARIRQRLGVATRGELFDRLRQAVEADGAHAPV